jgi:hypothetical protein
MLNGTKNFGANALEVLGTGTMLMTVVEGFQAFWFFCGGVAFLIGALIKYKEHKDKVQ